MNIPATLDLLPKLVNPMWQKMRQLYEKVAFVINGNISFGQTAITTGSTLIGQSVSPMTAVRVSGGNIDGVYVSVQTPAVADTDFTVIHNLGRVTSGYFILSPNKAGIIYLSPTNAVPYSITQVIYRCNVVSLTTVMFIF